jgi:hypothetical protein
MFCNKDREVTRMPIVEHVPPDSPVQLPDTNQRSQQSARPGELSFSLVWARL